MSYPIEAIRADFPILNASVNGKPLIYFDNGATTHRPKQVIDAVSNYYQEENSNVHRGSHTLGVKSTAAYEAARDTVAKHINAPRHLVNFTRGTTESINLVATAYGQKFIKSGAQILISELEHHSNIVPWQLLAEKTGAVIKPIPVDANGSIDLDAYRALLQSPTALVAVNYVSNALGVINPVKEMIALAHQHQAKILIDGAQATAHLKIDVQALDCDFLALSGHKVYAPMGIGVLYGKEDLLEQMDPYQGGGEMIDTVSFSGTTFNKLPYKFEAGTPYVSGAVGLAEALNYINSIGLDAIAEHEYALLVYATPLFKAVDGLKIYGDVEQKSAVISFVVDGVHNFDLATLLDKQGIAIRDGHHCCQPLMEKFGIEGTCRASFAMYNTKQEIDAFVVALKRAVNMLRG